MSSMRDADLSVISEGVRGGVEMEVGNEKRRETDNERMSEAQG